MQTETLQRTTIDGSKVAMIESFLSLGIQSTAEVKKARLESDRQHPINTVHI